ncbi:kinase-like domain-containing protein [Helicostylum pulchrum]|uniref:Uncharacterized protein n=1 Tax=Helicostylum pulchrum TaxID=562976 RepID=A0ABP9XKI3_9FUNG|nr:kinase-like domain-containing protein [Helicostylum pulchrum]
MGIVCCREELLDLDGEVELSHFTLLRSVGKGAFGKVRVVQHKGTKQLYALKYINKAKCIQMRAVENIISERKMLEQISCNLIVNMRYAFQDDDNLFMVLDLMLGGDLRFHLDRLGVLPEHHVRFYAAEVAVGLSYLHNLNIIHRDVKPDNILLDEQGHAHLTDFNIATIIKNQKPTTSIAGSFAYIAPEILLKRGYLASVDWWSMGIVLYELLFGKRPFRGKTNDALQQAILHDPVCFPEGHKISVQGIDFIKCLLTRDIKSRIGYGEQGFQRLMDHPWFEGIPWNKLETKEAEPPFAPDSKRANFDPTHELEEILLEDNPLKVKRRNPKRSGGAAASYVTSTNSKSTDANIPEQSPERQLMEDKFLVYDHTQPDENETRRKLIEQKYWAQRMNKTTGEEKHGPQQPDHAYGSTRKTVATYKASVLDYLNQKPPPPLSAGDILKLEELARTARNTNGKEKGAGWRPPSGLHGYSPPGATDAVLARDEYILLNGGVPPPSRPPPLAQSYNNDYPNERHHTKSKPSQEYSPTSYQTRRSSDDSYRLASSPDNSEYPLMGSVAALSEDYNIQQINNHIDNRNNNSKSPSSTNTNNNNNTPNITKMYSVSTISTNSSHTLHDPARSNITTSTTNTSASRTTPSRVSSIPRIHSNPLPPPTCLPPPIPSDLPALPPLPRNYI